MGQFALYRGSGSYRITLCYRGLYPSGYRKYIRISPSNDSILALAAGFIYDIFPAVTTVLIGTMLGSALGFYVTRTLLKEWVKEYVESRPLLMVQLI